MTARAQPSTSTPCP